MHLRYGMNPHQPAAIAAVDAGRVPFRVVNGKPSYINVLDAIGAWQLVREAAGAFGRPAAASFNHVSPAGAALDGVVDAAMGTTYGLDPDRVGAVTAPTSGHVMRIRSRRTATSSRWRTRSTPSWPRY